MNIPLLDLKAQYLGIRDEIQSAIDEVLKSQQFILGPQVEELERKIADYSGTKYAVGVSSGTDALLVSLMALNIKPGDEIITSPFTFFSTAGVIARLNARPVFIDIDTATFNMDPSQIASAITEKTRAILPVHLFGQCADMDPILQIAKNHNLSVVEDAAQSIGAEYKGKRAGAMGHCGVFSFFPSKNLGGCGDGGMVVTNDEALYRKIRLLRVHGSESEYFYKNVGGNFRLDAIQAAILNVKFRYLDTWTEKRRTNADDYDYRFQATGLIDKGRLAIPEAVHKKSGDRNYHVYNQYTIRVYDRDPLREFLKENGISTKIYYPLPLHLQESFHDLGYQKGDFPSAEEAARKVLSLPVYPELTAAQREFIIQKISDYYTGVS
ncbi:MAG: DegT/DnrJ/EryC1/StrS family aminotransferase [Candidatus Aminicenantales bacterium]